MSIYSKCVGIMMPLIHLLFLIKPLKGDRKKTLEILIYLFKTHFEFLGLVLFTSGRETYH